MNERGQIFTLDMFFALTLTLLVVSYSGLALEQARRQAEEYTLRYSLERTANDASDVLVKTLGRPDGWENDITTLETLGLAEENEGRPVQNALDVGKLGLLRELCRAGNWDPSKSEVQAVMDLFGGSENFEIKLARKELLWRELLAGLDFENEITLFGVEIEVDAENMGAVIDVQVELEWDKEVETGAERAPEFTLVVQAENLSVEVIVGGGVMEVWSKLTLWDIWPGWDVEDSSGVENSLEVVVVRRSVATRSGSIKGEVRSLVHLLTPTWNDYILDFEIYPGELDAFDWYIVLRPSKESSPTTHIWVNRPAVGGKDYDFPPDTIFTPRHHGADDPTLVNPLVEGSNYLTIRVKGSKWEWVDVYIIAVPSCTSLEAARLAPDKVPATLEVKLWR